MRGHHHHDALSFTLLASDSRWGATREDARGTKLAGVGVQRAPTLAKETTCLRQLLDPSDPLDPIDPLDPLDLFGSSLLSSYRRRRS